MKDFGISKKDLDQKLLTSLVILGDVGAYLIREKQIQRTYSSQNKIENLKKIIPLSTLKKIEDIDEYQKSKLRNSFFLLNPKIYDFPVQSLINTIINNPSLNNKLCKLSFEIKLIDIENAIKNNTLKKKYSDFTTADNNNLKKSILLLNFVTNQELRTQNNLCFSKEILEKISGFSDSKDVYKYLIKTGKGGDKHKLKEIFKEMPEDVAIKDLFSFLTSLSTDIALIWNSLHSRKRDYLLNNFSLYKKMRFENFSWAKRKILPAYAVTMFESSNGRKINNIKPFFMKRFLRVENLSFLDPKFRVVTEKKDSILKNLDILYKNFHDA